MLADEFGFQPSELMAMDEDDMAFWLERRKELNERRGQAQARRKRKRRR